MRILVSYDLTDLTNQIDGREITKPTPLNKLKTFTSKTLSELKAEEKNKDVHSAFKEKMKKKGYKDYIIDSNRDQVDLPNTVLMIDLEDKPNAGMLDAVKEDLDAVINSLNVNQTIVMLKSFIAVEYNDYRVK